MVTYRTATVTPHREPRLTFEVLVEYDKDKLWIEAPRATLFPHTCSLPTSFDMHVIDGGTYTFSDVTQMVGDNVFFGWRYVDRATGFSCLAARKPIAPCKLLQP